MSWAERGFGFYPDMNLKAVDRLVSLSPPRRKVKKPLRPSSNPKISEFPQLRHGRSGSTAALRPGEEIQSSVCGPPAAARTPRVEHRHRNDDEDSGSSRQTLSARFAEGEPGEDAQRQPHRPVLQ
ncbi:Hypothetical predicted protein [Xyrichtys novacula]|uniref:Uncharacterized protein n=1 Tax=Xyrichtys novacula TaxID=13765 RepID=A0AAV1HPZ0_XYRNO|nr:Hypothetical predicted protein [Xyrichtys novacula]